MGTPIQVTSEQYPEEEEGTSEQVPELKTVLQSQMSHQI